MRVQPGFYSGVSPDCNCRTFGPEALHLLEEFRFRADRLARGFTGWSRDGQYIAMRESANAARHEGARIALADHILFHEAVSQAKTVNGADRAVHVVLLF